MHAHKSSREGGRALRRTPPGMTGGEYEQPQPIISGPVIFGRGAGTSGLRGRKSDRSACPFKHSKPTFATSSKELSRCIKRRLWTGHRTKLQELKRNRGGPMRPISKL